VPEGTATLARTGDSTMPDCPPHPPRHVRRHGETIACTRCGLHRHLPLTGPPAAVAMRRALVEEFTDQHRDCKPSGGIRRC
jgi:hypothetical protein